MIRRVLDAFRFLADLTAVENSLAADTDRKNSKDAEALIAHVTALASGN